MTSASPFIAPSIGLAENIKQEFLCAIHQSLLENTIALPCFHRFCRDCLASWIRQNSPVQVRCPTCNAQHAIPSNWQQVWRDRSVDAIIKHVQSTESDMKAKILDFVKNSYYKFGKTNDRIKIKSIELVFNGKLKADFEKCKRTLGYSNVVTLLHGTKLSAAKTIASQGFKIPTSFERNGETNTEGRLKFGKAMYFALGKKASEYGENTLVLTDCLLGKVEKKAVVEMELTPNEVHRRGYHTIHYENNAERPVNQEWAIYRVDQCLPLCIIDYEIIDESQRAEQAVVDRVKAMNGLSPDRALLQEALFGTDNQCKAVLEFIGDLAKQQPSQASRAMCSLLLRAGKTKARLLLSHANETIRILFLRALWLSGRSDEMLQGIIFNQVGSDILVNLLVSGYDDLCWRACGVLANMAAVVLEVRCLLVTSQVLEHMLRLLKRGVANQDKLCLITVLNLLANIACTEYAAMKRRTDIQAYLDQTLLDHPDEEIQGAANRFFCNLIGKGTVTPDWRRAGYKEAVSAPKLD